MGVTVGEKIGPYEVNALLGVGGMGEVYRAYDPRLGRYVAIKTLLAASAGHRSWVARFKREARAVAALDHPNVMAIHDVGEQGGVPYLVAEWLDGETLRARLAAGPIPVHAALEYMRQIVDGLAAAHARGVVHRDLKPENLLITREGVVKLLDFGIAKLNDPEDTLDAEHPRLGLGGTDLEPLTATGTVLGTIGYMSPEQLRAETVDARSDIFSFGAVAYEMVTGQRAFDAASRPALAAAILNREPGPVRTSTGPAPAALERLVRRCLKKRRDERFQSTPELAEALRAFARSSRAGRARGGAQHRAWRWAGAAALMSLLGVGGYRLSPPRSGTIDSIAVLPFTNVNADPSTEYLSQGITESIVNGVSRLPGVRVPARSTVAQYLTSRDPSSKADPKKVGRELGVAAVLVGRVLERGGQLNISAELVRADDGSQLWGEHYEKHMSAVLRVRQEVTRDIAERLGLQLGSADKAWLNTQPTQNVEAYQLYLKGTYLRNKGTLLSAAVQYGTLSADFEKIPAYFQQALDLDSGYALAYAALAQFYGFAAARGLLPPNDAWPKAEAMATKAVELDSTLSDQFYHLQASLRLSYHRDWPTSERAFERAIQLNPNEAEIRQHYANSLMLVGRPDDARRVLKQAQELDPLSTRFTPASGVVPLMLAYWARDPDELIAQCEKRTAQNPNDVFAHDMLGNAYEQKGMLAAAVAAWRKAMALSRDDRMLTIVDRVSSESSPGAVLRAVWEERLQRLRQREASGQYVPAARFAGVYAKLGDAEQAFAWLDKAVDERSRLVLEVGIDPVFDHLRSDPRFGELVRRVRLAP